MTAGELLLEPVKINKILDKERFMKHFFVTWYRPNNEMFWTEGVGEFSLDPAAK